MTAPSTTTMGMPRLPAVINGKEALILLDTGASSLLEASGISPQGFPPERMSQRRADAFVVVARTDTVAYLPALASTLRAGGSLRCEA
ncbi:TPA: hypothetical protein UMT89_000634 [Stenotrophomonas maltophilia]|nr:hypothetical protein [Stenotrophomonas maltophilia]